MEQASKDLKFRDNNTVNKSEELECRKQVDLKSALHLKYDKREVVVRQELKTELVLHGFSTIEILKLQRLD